MDSPELPNPDRSDEMRELQRSDGGSCAPKVISSLRQLRRVTEGGLAIRKRRRTCLPPQNVVSRSRENTGMWTTGKNSTAGTDKNSSTWDISGPAGDHLYRPCAVFRKTHSPCTPGTRSVVVNGGRKEGCVRLLSAFENGIMEETACLPVRKAGCRTRVEGVFRKFAPENETEKEGRRYFSVDEAPTRAPSQKSIAKKEAVSNRTGSVSNLHVLSQTSSHVLCRCEERILEVTRTDKVPVEDVTDERSHRGNARIETASSRTGEEGDGGKKEVSCNACVAEARYPEVGEAEDRKAQVHKHNLRERASPGQNSRRLEIDTAELKSRWNRLGTGASGSDESVRGLGELTEQGLYNCKTTHQTSPMNCKRQIKDALDGGGLGYEVLEAKTWQNHSSSPRETAADEISTERQPCIEDELQRPKVGNGDAQIPIAQPRSNEKPHRVTGRSRTETSAVFSAVNSPRIPVSSLPDNQATENHVSYRLSSERVVFSPRREPDAAGGSRRKTRLKEQVASAIAKSSPTGDPNQVQGAVQANEGTNGEQAADIENKTPAPQPEITIHQKTVLAASSCDSEEFSENGGANSSILFAPSFPNEGDNTPPLFPTLDPHKAHAEGESSQQFSSRDASGPGLFTHTSTKMPHYHHVQEASPRHPERFSTQTPHEKVQHASSLFPVVKGVSRDNAKRRWAVYWKGSRRYFYDKLNENCYNAYQQAVNFRKYSRIHDTSKEKDIAAAKTPPDYMKDKASQRESPTPSSNTSTASQTSPSNHRTGAGALTENIQLGISSLCKSEAAAEVAPQGPSARVAVSPVLAPNAYKIQLHDHIPKQGHCDLQLEGVPQYASKNKLPLQEDRGEAAVSLRCTLPPRDAPVTPLLDMYKTALLLVLQDLEASLTDIPTGPTLTESFSPMKCSTTCSNDCEGNGLNTTCARPTALPNDIPSSHPIARSTQTTNRDLRLRPFLLLIIQWHLDNVRLASHRRDLQPLLDVFSSCFQHLLLPRQAPRPLQQKIYKDLIELHNVQALCHLTSA